MIVAAKLDVFVDWMHIGWCWLLDSRLNNVSAMQLRENAATARSMTVPHFVTHLTK